MDEADQTMQKQLAQKSKPKFLAKRPKPLRKPELKKAHSPKAKKPKAYPNNSPSVNKLAQKLGVNIVVVKGQKRLGVVRFCPKEYVVDLDDERMVNAAKELIYEQIVSLYGHDQILRLVNVEPTTNAVKVSLTKDEIAQALGQTRNTSSEEDPTWIQ